MVQYNKMPVVTIYRYEGVVAQWCNPLTLKSEQSSGVGSISGRTPPFERHSKNSRTRLGLLDICDPCAWRKKLQFHFHLHFVCFD